MSDHTPEPWHVREELDGVYSGTKTWIKGEKFYIAKTTNQTRCQTFHGTDELHEANAQRIVQCVNALSGIEDVEGFMKTSRNRLEGILLELHERTTMTESETVHIRQIVASILAIFPNQKDSTS